MAPSVTPDPSSVRLDGPWSHRDVSANGIRFHVAEAGSGPLVLLLHGFGQFWWAWRHQLPALAEAGYRVVAPDLRGYGDTDKPPTGYDAFVLADDIAGLIRGLGERRAILIGNGFGGLAAHNTAVIHPDRVSAVVSIAAAHPASLARLRRGAGRYQDLLSWARWPYWPERTLLADDAAELENIYRRDADPRWTATADFESAIATYRQALCVPGAAACAIEHLRWVARSRWQADGIRHRELLAHHPVHVPVLTIGGTEDPVIPPALLAASAEHCSGAHHLERIPGGWHYPAEEQPEAVTEAILRFLSFSRPSI